MSYSTCYYVRHIVVKALQDVDGSIDKECCVIVSCSRQQEGLENILFTNASISNYTNQYEFAYAP